jgi:hypothetical protein
LPFEVKWRGYFEGMVVSGMMIEKFIFLQRQEPWISMVLRWVVLWSEFGGVVISWGMTIYQKWDVLRSFAKK